MGFSRQDTEVVCHSLLQWTTFCQTSPPWPIRLGWSPTASLSFIELDKAVVCVIRLASFLWLWFHCVCPLMPSHNIYHLTSVSLTLDMLQMCYLTWNEGWWASLVPHLAENLPEMQETPVHFLDQEDSPGEGRDYPLQCSWAALVAQSVKDLPAMWETWVQPLSWEDPLEEGMATHSSILA